MHVSFRQWRAIDIDLPIDQPDMVSGDAYDSLHKVQSRIERIVKHDDVAALHLAIGQRPAEKIVGAEVQLIHQKVIASEKRILHGL